MDVIINGNESIHILVPLFAKVHTQTIPCNQYIKTMYLCMAKGRLLYLVCALRRSFLILTSSYNGIVIIPTYAAAFKMLCRYTQQLKSSQTRVHQVHDDDDDVNDVDNRLRNYFVYANFAKSRVC
jgi:hypothetical protein